MRGCCLDTILIESRHRERQSGSAHGLIALRLEGEQLTEHRRPNNEATLLSMGSSVQLRWPIVDLLFVMGMSARGRSSQDFANFRLDLALAAQCEIPPPIAQYPFEIVSQRGVSHPFALFSKGIAQVSLRYPFGGGVSHLHFACSPRGKCSEKGEGVSHPIGHVETPKTP